MIKLGPRIIKTGIAVSITMFILNRFKLEPAVFGAVSAVVNLQPSLYTSFKTAMGQIKIHLLGVIAGMIFGYIFGGNPIAMGLVTITIIYTYKRLKLQNGIIMGIVAAIFIITSPASQFVSHALSRTAVIFTGLIVSSFVNIILWPPRYREKLIDKIQEADIAVVNYFCHAVDDFVFLDSREVHSHPEAKNKVYALITEARQIAQYIQSDVKLRNDSDKILDYVEGTAEKADLIYEIISTRMERREKSGNPPISEEFRAILDLLADGCNTINSVNANIRSIILDNLNIKGEKIHERYWTSLTEKIEQWHYKLNSSYYVHALIDVGVVANEIRWVSRQGKKLVNDLIYDV